METQSSPWGRYQTSQYCFHEPHANHSRLENRNSLGTWLARVHKHCCSTRIDELFELASRLMSTAQVLENFHARSWHSTILYFSVLFYWSITCTLFSVHNATQFFILDTIKIHSVVCCSLCVSTTQGHPQATRLFHVVGLLCPPLAIFSFSGFKWSSETKKLGTQEPACVGWLRCQLLTPCSLLEFHRRFGWTYCLHPQCVRVNRADQVG
jgi:hypothetical protein